MTSAAFLERFKNKKSTIGRSGDISFDEQSAIQNKSSATPTSQVSFSSKILRKPLQRPQKQDPYQFSQPMKQSKSSALVSLVTNTESDLQEQSTHQNMAKQHNARVSPPQRLKPKTPAVLKRVMNETKSNFYVKTKQQITDDLRSTQPTNNKLLNTPPFRGPKQKLIKPNRGIIPSVKSDPQYRVAKSLQHVNFTPYTLQDYKANHPLPAKYAPLGGIGAVKNEEWTTKKKLYNKRKKYSNLVTQIHAQNLNRSELAPLPLQNERPSSQNGRKKAIDFAKSIVRPKLHTPMSHTFDLSSDQAHALEEEHDRYLKALAELRFSLQIK